METAKLPYNEMPNRKQKVWIDADTGNEIDDPYAIVRALVQPTIDVVGVSSVHFNNADLVAFDKWNQYFTRDIDTVGISQQLNEEILHSMNLDHIAHPRGADRQIGRAWGGSQPRPSSASTQLIEAAHRLEPGERLDIIAIGALTNVASAIIIDPEIVPLIRCFALAGQYDFKTKVWNKNDFNIRGDLNAFDYLMDQPNFDLTLLPTNIARPFVFQRDTIVEKLDDQKPVQKLLKQRWLETEPTSELRVLWDLALVEAYLLPNLATLQTIGTPPENLQRLIHAYAEIDTAAMTQDFWDAIFKAV
jgi:inosine-uridine nucleoside N-ribohydrolase